MSLLMTPHLSFTPTDWPVVNGSYASNEHRGVLPGWLRQLTEVLVIVGPELVELLCLAFGAD